MTLSTKGNYFYNKIFFKDSRKMTEIPDNSINLIITSPPYFNIKDYSLEGYQKLRVTKKNKMQIGDIDQYDVYISEMLKVWQECERILKPNGKLIINTPLMPMQKKDLNTHYNRDIFNIDSDIQYSIRTRTGLYLYDMYIWNRTNSSKKIMFGSYPYPRNFYAQNTSEFITVYVKDGVPEKIEHDIKESSKLTKEEWLEYTKQIWNITIPSKSDLAFGTHSAIMPEEIIKRCTKLFSFVGDVILDPFAGSGTTLKVAKELNRNYVGYELYDTYKDIIIKKINSVGDINE